MAVLVCWCVIFGFASYVALLFGNAEAFRHFSLIVWIAMAGILVISELKPEKKPKKKGKKQ